MRYSTGMDSTELTSCPKCSRGYIPQYKHIEGGVCFLCGGKGEVTLGAASRWLAAQLRQDLPRSTESTAESTPAPTKRWKRVDLPSFPPGAVHVAKGTGDYEGLFLVKVASDVGDLTMHVQVHRGRVSAVQSTICNGLLKHANKIVRELQAKLIQPA